MEMGLNSVDRSVVLYGVEAEAALLMGYHPQRQGGKCSRLKYRLSLVSSGSHKRAKQTEALPYSSHTKAKSILMHFHLIVE